MATASIRVSLTDVAAGTVGPRLRTAIKGAMKSVAMGFADGVRQVAPVDSGDLRVSIQADNPVDEGGAITCRVTALPHFDQKLSGHGGKGKFPKMGPIEQWARHKGLDGSLNVAPWMKGLLDDSVRSPGQGFNDAERLRLAAYFIARKIANKGVAANKRLTSEVIRQASVIPARMATEIPKFYSAQGGGR